MHVVRRTPSHHIVERWPTGYETWVCCTSFGRFVVPDVKYSRAVSPAGVGPSGTNSSVVAAASANRFQSAGSDAPTPMRRTAGSIPSRRSARAPSVTTASARPCSMRYARSEADSRVEVGIDTAPSLVIASITSHSSIVLLSMTITWSPRPMPRLRSQAAT